MVVGRVMPCLTATLSRTTRRWRAQPRAYIEHIAPFFTLDGLEVIYELNTKG